MIPTPSRSLLISAIKSSTAQKNPSFGKSIHAQIIKSGYLPEIQLFNHLLNLYCKSNDFVSANKLVDEMPERNLVSFATLISGYSRSDNPQYSLSLVPHLQEQDLSPNQFVFSSLILACSRLKWVDSGEQIHSQVIVSGFESDPFVQASLIDMYSKCYDLESAVSVFRSSPLDDLVIFNSVISGHVSLGSYEEAFELFVELLRNTDLWPTEYTFASVIKACSNLGIDYGEQIHAYILKIGLESDCFIGTSLVDMYGKLADVESSDKMFQATIAVGDIALYNSMISVLSNNNLHERVLEVFNELKSEGIDPNESTLCSLLKSCGGMKWRDLGRIVHGVVLKSEFYRDLFTNTALIDMYMKCGCIEVSNTLFATLTERNTVVYNAMIHGLAQNGCFNEALRLFIDMSRCGIEPNPATFVALINSCVGVEKSVFSLALKHGFGSDLSVQNVFLDVLAKGGVIDDAQLLFSKMKERDVVSWTIMISGLSQFGLHYDALKMFKKMQLESVFPNNFTFSCVAKACGTLADMELGICIQASCIKHGIMDEDYTLASLLDMYAKCGALQHSSKLFDESPDRNIIAWNTMIASHAQFGNGHEALALLEKMERKGLEPNQVTFTSLLSACSRCGLVDEGIHVFELITGKYGLKPSMEHFASVVDLLGRAGLLERAKDLIDGMPYEPDTSIKMSFLASCKMHGNVELAEYMKNHLLKTGSLENSGLVLMSNIYSESGKWDDAANVRNNMILKGLKEPGMSWVQIKE
ncbi:hypothetical protein Scep_022030 [Stephania cephalantha]|uniref:Pentatricopeptide repeat-containing protein n=1 Tax=Stephania cephalantha TaxID=152367 RepID=A0AAP0F4K3_9MAGN